VRSLFLPLIELSQREISELGTKKLRPRQEVGAWADAAIFIADGIEVNSLQIARAAAGGPGPQQRAVRKGQATKLKSTLGSAVRKGASDHTQTKTNKTLQKNADLYRRLS
jgi:hypothetical protein